MDKRSKYNEIPFGIEIRKNSVLESLIIHISKRKDSSGESLNLRNVRQTLLLSRVGTCCFMVPALGGEKAKQLNCMRYGKGNVCNRVSTQG